MELLHNDRVDIRLYSPQALAFWGMPSMRF